MRIAIPNLASQTAKVKKIKKSSLLKRLIKAREVKDIIKTNPRSSKFKSIKNTWFQDLTKLRQTKLKVRTKKSHSNANSEPVNAITINKRILNINFI